jgi:hypothetical protein
MFRVKFKDGRLSFAEREWYSSKVTPFAAMIGALEQFKDASARCSIVPKQDKSPDSTLESVFITCGLRTVLIRVAAVNGMSIADVMEQIDSEQ